MDLLQVQPPQKAVGPGVDASERFSAKLFLRRADRWVVRRVFKMSNFLPELRELINKHSKEKNSNTPDFALATYLRDCLDSFDRAVRVRDAYYNFEPKELKDLK